MRCTKQPSDASPDVEGIETVSIDADREVGVSDASPDVEGIETPT